MSMTKRMGRGLEVRIILFAALLAFSSQVWGFTIPERLEYEVSYAGIPAGRAVQEVTQSGNDIHIVSTARSAEWLNYFFRVEDRIESVLSAGTPRLFHERISEGRTRYQKDAVFDRQNMEVVTRDFLNKSETTHKISSQTYDTLSGFYYFRTIGLQVGKSSFIEIFDCKKLWNTEVQVLRREEIEIALGRFQTVVIRPILQSEGIFARTGDLHIWLTDDDRRIPVMMK
ncbi:MAG: DUF3108 domain-containing protein, partial [Verrucomicrobiota bacterium]